MMDRLTYPGDFCQQINLSNELINSANIKAIPEGTLKIGVVVELIKYATKTRTVASKVEEWVCSLQPDFESMKKSTLKARIKNAFEIHKKIERKKKVASYVSLTDLHNDLFLPVGKRQLTKVQPETSSVNECSPKTLIETDTDKNVECEMKDDSDKFQSETAPNIQTQTETDQSPLQCEYEIKTAPNSQAQTETVQKSPSQSDIPSARPEVASAASNNSPVQIMTENSPIPNRSEDTKHLNLLQHEIDKRQKALSKMNTLVKAEQESLEHLKSVKGHFSVRNVTKRDQNAIKTRKTLRDTQAIVTNQRRQLEKTVQKNQELVEKVHGLEHQHVELLTELEKLKETERKKVNAQKLNSYYRKTMKKMRESPHSKQEPTDVLRNTLMKCETEIENLKIENEILKETLNEKKHKTKNDDGTFSNEIRLCVMELFGLEIAVEKIPLAIETVGKHLYGITYQKQDLPNHTSVQNIVDEGHFLAKTFIASQIEKSTNFGISRDGTTRRKEKIVDTSVTLDSGDVMSLGFTKVARETAEVITEVTKNHFDELSRASSAQKKQIDNHFIARSLEKVAFTMSDRASNEKLADKLLAKWRDDTLNECENETQRTTVLHFHCMAHVLLGFHRYVCDNMKKHEAVLIEKEGPVGRDRLPVFKYWSKKQSVIERVAYTTSSIFGPAGDHLGIRDRWEAYCASQGIRSVVGNYKDNRFNALFQTAAEIFLHREDFLHVLKTVQNPNLKLKSVQADLESETVQTMLKCLSIMYVKVTGPYWWLVTSSDVSYLELYSHIQSLEKFLKACELKPENLLVESMEWLNYDDTMTIPHLEKFISKLAEVEKSDLLLTLLGISCNAMLRTVQKQLVDFLEGGQYSRAPSKEDLQRTSFAQVTNLSCEHHFGDLDSSQKRRPNASFHHHSSVQMLKRNRKKLFEWIGDMDTEDQDALLKTARKGGRDLRKEHRMHEIEVIKDIENMMKEKPKSKRRKLCDLQDIEIEDDYEIETLDNLLPKSVCFNDNEYVAVAYQDAWYPGVIITSSDNVKATVNFMIPCRRPGTFMWPARQDKQTVEKQFILKQGLIPECCNNGRQWFFSEFDDINKVYALYKEHYFS